jgi:hypothetical protein
MHSRFVLARCLLLPVALALALSCAVARAQSFSADYDLLRSQEAVTAPAMQFGSISLAPALQSQGDVSGAGLSLSAGRSWYGQVALGHAAAPAWRAEGSDVLSVGGGYRFPDGQAMSLQFSRGRGPDRRLGLAVGYDWPRYFLRFSWDQRLNVAPQDSLRFSAGLRF